MDTRIEIYNNIVNNYDETIDVKNQSDAHLYFINNHDVSHVNFYIKSSRTKLFRYDFMSIESIECKEIKTRSVELHNEINQFFGKHISYIIHKYAQEIYTVELSSNECSAKNGILHKEVIHKPFTKCLANIIIPFCLIPFSDICVHVKDRLGRDMNANFVYKATMIQNNLLHSMLSVPSKIPFICEKGIVCRYGSIDQSSIDQSSKL